jgi:hypothetical protein
LKELRMRRHRSLWLAGAAALVLALWLALRPEPEVWREFVPWCGSNRNPIPIEGALRERFLWLMSKVYTRHNVEHVIRDGRIYTRGEGSFDGRPETLLDIESNAQPKVVSDIAEALVEAIRASEPRFGPFPPRNEKGERIYGPDMRFEDCELTRLAILKKP